MFVRGLLRIWSNWRYLGAQEKEFAKSVEDEERKLCGGSTAQFLPVFSGERAVELAVLVVHSIETSVKRQIVVKRSLRHGVSSPDTSRPLNRLAGTVSPTFRCVNKRSRCVAAFPQLNDERRRSCSDWAVAA